jgi:hypothetical protein
MTKQREQPRKPKKNTGGPATASDGSGKDASRGTNRERDYAQMNGRSETEVAGERRIRGPRKPEKIPAA